MKKIEFYHKNDIEKKSLYTLIDDNVYWDSYTKKTKYLKESINHYFKSGLWIKSKNNQKLMVW